MSSDVDFVVTVFGDCAEAAIRQRHCAWDPDDLDCPASEVLELADVELLDVWVKNGTTRTKFNRR